ncbi:MAG: hypothetical protein ACI9U2_003580 [Bradymonadia bacterium]|jgi:hypothetical protein
MRFFLKSLFVMSLAAPAATLAQDAEPTSDPVQIKAFEKAERMTDLRHKHLWLAYGAAWLIICGFVWRTHSMSKQTDSELMALKRKIEGFEEQQNG